MLPPHAQKANGLLHASRDTVTLDAHPQSPPVAIIGYAGRFPGSENVEQFWQNLVQGVDCVVDIPPGRWNQDAYFDHRPATALRTYCNQGGFLQDIHQFDYAFFSISEDESCCMDPKQRLLMQTVYHGLEHAGYGGDTFCGTDTGVFIGSSYYHHEHEMPIQKVISPFGMLGTSNTLLANRISNIFNFKGPSCLIDTFCSSSMMAVHLACQSLTQGECRVAIAGGVHLLSLIHYISLSQFRALSAKGRCKTFDQDADGFVPGEGVGIVVLKPLETALKDRDSIHAIIKGSAVNHTGRSSSLTSPSAESQSLLIQAAYANAGVPFDTISYIETHGTGTKLGDPLEIKALKDAFKDKTSNGQHCILGSVKTNIGHLEPASGIAGLIKVLLSLKHRKIPGVLHLKELNRFIHLENSPFTINNKTIDWQSSFAPRRAGVSSFGLSGTNVHMVVEEPPPKNKPTPQGLIKNCRLFVLSARSWTGLRKLAQDTINILNHYPDDSLNDICFTQAVGRKHFDQRFSCLCHNVMELKQRLEEIVQHADNEFDPQKEGYKGWFSCNAAPPSEVAIFFNDDFHSDIQALSPFWPYPAFSEAFYQAMLNIKACLPDNQSREIKISDRSKPLLTHKPFPYFRLAAAQAFFKLLCSWRIYPKIISGHGLGFINACLAAKAIRWQTALALHDQLKNDAKENIRITIENQPTIALVDGPICSTAVGVQTGDEIYPGNNKIIEKPCYNFSKQNERPFTVLMLGKNHNKNLLACQSQNTKVIQLFDSQSDSWSSLCGGLGKLYASGIQINWPEFYKPDTSSRVPLAAYPFEGPRLATAPDNEPTIMKMLLNPSEYTRISAMPQQRQKVEKTSIFNEQPSESGDSISDYLLNTIARRAGLAKEEIDPNSNFDEIGMDSIMKVELSYEILEQYSGLEQVGQELIEALSIRKFIDIIRKSLGSSSAPRRETSDCKKQPSELEAMHKEQKKHLENMASGTCRIENQKLIANLRVNEEHLFFFDHPLDHVSGVHQLESMIQAVTTAHYAFGCQEPQDLLFFKDVHVEFKNICPKTGSTLIETSRMEFTEGSKNSEFYTAFLKDKQKIYCNAFFKIDASQKTSPLSLIQTPADYPFETCEKSMVNKLNQLNVFIGKPVLKDAKEESMIFPLRPIGHHPYFSDYAGNHVPSIYIMEAFRQTQRYIHHLQTEADEKSNYQVSLLLSLSLSLNRPVFRDETVQIAIGRIKPKNVGKNILVNSSGWLRQGDSTIGSCRSQNIIISHEK